MKGMILSAGFGARLKPLTDSTPKALIEYKGAPMINYQVERMRDAGIKEIIINAHHHSGQLVKYFEENNLGVKIRVTVEKEILGTGGGILNTASYFEDEDYFPVINADIHTNINLRDLVRFAFQQKPFAVIAVQKRETSRYLQFNDEMRLLKRSDGNSPPASLYAFNGMHVISSDIFRQEFKVKFSDIIDIYLEMQARGKKILGYDVGEAKFMDLGKHENLNG